MADEKKLLKVPHNIIIEDRKTITVTGVSDIDSFDEQVVVAYTEYGELTIKGLGLHVNKIDVDSGELNVEGEIYALSYEDTQTHKGGLLAKLFR